MERIKFTKIDFEYDKRSESMKYFEDGWVSVLKEDLEKAMIEKWKGYGYKIHLSTLRGALRTLHVKENPIEFLECGGK